MKKYTPFPIFQSASRFHDKTVFSDFDKGIAKSGGEAYGAGIIHGTGLPFSVQDRLKETAVMKDINKVKERRS